MSDREQLYADIAAILKGIDEQETDSDRGWWETSVGAAYGAECLRQIKDRIFRED